MSDFLRTVLLQKRKELAELSLAFNVEKRISNKSFKHSLIKNKNELAVIAEIKRKSPSVGLLADIEDVVALAKSYVNGRTNALSVLTDRKFFGGSIQDLRKVADAVKNTDCPVLRKDFIIDYRQITEAILAGADAVLLIVALLKEKTEELLKITKEMNVEALVEVHNEKELEIACDAGAEIIGVNNRNLKTLQVDINNSFKLISLIPNGIVKISASGITSPDIAKKLYKAGFDAVLIGSELVKASDPAKFILEVKSE